jgi:serine/threonine-protein kinase
MDEPKNDELSDCMAINEVRHDRHTDIPAYPTFARIEPLDKGYSGDKKYRIETRGGEHLLLRVSDVSIPAPDNLADWSERYFAVIDERLDAYRGEGVPFEGGGVTLSFLKNNRGLLKNRLQRRHHGDYHYGTLKIN